LAIQGEYRIGAPRAAVWQALNDTEVLKACIPGCEELVRKSDTEIEGRINAQLGPVRSVFATTILLTDLNPPAGYTLTGEGKGVAGFGKGSAKVDLTEEGSSTVLRYTADMMIGGKLAQVGSRLVEGATRQLADQFFASFSTRLDSQATRVEEAPATAATAGSGSAPGDQSSARPRWGLIAAGAVIAALGLWWWLN
jgi:carbon monoxide dehydrogenase subunit G